MTSADINYALEVLDALPVHEVERIRVALAATVGSRDTDPSGLRPVPTPGPETDPFFAAVTFYLWSTSNVSLERSL